MISADGAMYASKRAGKNRVTGVPMPRPGRPVDAGVASPGERHRPPTAARRASGFSTRAIRAASRIPALDQPPTSVPIYQTATFASADADELGAVAADRPAGLRLQPDRQPDRRARSARPSPSWTAARRPRRSPRGMGAIHAALASLRARPATGSSRRDRDLRLDPVAAAAARSAGSASRIGVRRRDRPRRRRGRALAAAPTRVLYVETISNPTIVVADLAALAELAHRHGATYVVDNTFASPYLCRPLELGRGPRRRVGHEVPRRPQRRHRRASSPGRASASPRSARPDRHRRDASARSPRSSSCAAS